MGIAGAVVLFCSNASAVQFTDVDAVGSLAVNATTSGTSFVISNPGDGTGVFGFSNSEYALSSATVDFSFFRLPDAASRVEITIGGLVFVGASFTTGNYTHIGGLLSAALLNDLNDGEISYSIKNISAGSVIVSGVALNAQANRVPDGAATIGLMGLALIGVVCFGQVDRTKFKIGKSL